MLGAVPPGTLPAVIPTVLIGGPLAILALLFPPLAAMLALALRRWRVLLLTLTLSSTIYLVHAWFRGYLKGLWWGPPAALWTVLAAIFIAGGVWAFLRWRTNGGDSTPRLEERIPYRSELLILWIVSLAGLAIVLTRIPHDDLFTPPWRELLVLCCALCLAAVYGLGVRAASRAVRFPATEGVMLCALGIGSVALAFPSHTPEAPPEFRVVWTYEQPQRGAVLSSSLVSGKHVYIAAIRDTGLSARGVVYCLDADSGHVVWRFDDGGTMQHMYSSPCLSDGRLYIGEGMHANYVCKLYCIDATSGKKLWDFTTAGHIESSPCVADGKVYFASGDDGIYCLDAVAGQKHWHYKSDCHIDSSLAVVAGRVYGGSGVSRRYQETEAFCLDAGKGEVLWRVPTDLPVWGSPTVVDGLVYLGLGNGRLDRSAPKGPAGAVLCVRAKDGQRLWRYDVPDAVLNRPTVNDKHVYFGARDGRCYCVDRMEGVLVWKAEVGSPVVTQPALCDDRLYVVACDGQVLCLDADTGQSHWTFDLARFTQTRPRLASSPAVEVNRTADEVKRRIYFGTELKQSVSSAAVLYCLED